MAELTIVREKAWVGVAIKMNCYVNGEVVCKLKNGEETICEVPNDILEFKCNLTNNPMSDIVYIDMKGQDFLKIAVKQGAWQPTIDVFDKGAIVGNEMQKREVAKKSLFTPTKAVGNYFGVDETSRQWLVGKGLIPSFKNLVPYRYEDIVDFELLEDGSSIVKGGLGRAAVGGLLLGGTGAIVGAITGAKKTTQTCTSLMIKITLNDVNCPVEYIKLITTSTNKNSLTYKVAFSNAQEILSLLQLIVSKCENKAPSETTNVQVNNVSSADEIRKYKSLYDDGIITEEEFLNKKKQLLGL